MRYLTPHRYSRQRGLSLIEMMVGITIGMIVVAGASVLMTRQVTEHGKLSQETQVQQDLRATADLMLRDLRRAGFWAAPQNGVWAPPSVPGSPPLVAAQNAYGLAVDPDTNVQVEAVSEDCSQVQYSYSRAGDYRQPAANAPTENNHVDPQTESFGFRLSNDVLQSMTAGRWQALTDPDTLTVTAFCVRVVVQPLSLAEFCPQPCPAGATACPPQQEVRRFDVSITGHSKRDTKVVRTVTVSSRVRNDRIVGSCT